jgi:hypothetical protein
MARDLGFVSFDTPHITLVRNELIEHAIASNPNWVFGSDLPFGPVVKPIGLRVPTPRKGKPGRESVEEATFRAQDPGMYESAKEVIREVVRVLSNREARI